tara:strand:+ start:7514 stop:7672 length:159 start_codon:yes stop_codon:yes gene_type:complete
LCNHDVALLVINPKGARQAVFKPNDSVLREKPFNANVIYQNLMNNPTPRLFA